MKKYISILFLFFIAVSFGQRKYAAEKYFKEFSYVKSAELYKQAVKEGDSTLLVLNRLADSFYFNNNSLEAEKWYRKLFKLYENDSIKAENYFKYAQSLKTNGNYTESDIWLTKFRKLNKNDSRGKQLENKTNYLSEYTKNKEKFQNIHNLAINTKYSDFGTFIKDSIVLFASTRPKGKITGNKIYSWNTQPYLNLYQAKEVVFMNEVAINFSDLSTPSKIEAINTKYHEASAVITNDGKTMYFTRDNFDGKKLRSDKNKVTHLKIFKAKLIDGKWSEIKELPFNSNLYSVGHPALSPDQKTLYFVSDMPNGFGKTDIYKVDILENGYGDPQNLGATINTEGKEMFPFISKDNFLYFSSDGHLGLGSLDVFESRIETSGTFNAVKNLATPINSQKDDFAFIVDDKSKRGYFSSNRDGGKGDDDIYSFVIHPKKKIKPICNQRVTGQIRDKITNKLLPGSSVTLFDINNQKVDSLIVGENAYFEFLLPCNQKYRLVAFKRYYSLDTQHFSTIPIKGDIKAKRVDLRLNDDFRYSQKFEMIININPIYFDFNKSNIRPDAAKELDKVIAVMNKYPELIIQSSSHTDSSGRAIYNEALSERRAQSTVKYIISKGINPNRISGKGLGETQLVNECADNVKCSKEEHQLNRRTEFVIIKSN